MYDARFKDMSNKQLNAYVRSVVESAKQTDEIDFISAVMEIRKRHLVTIRTELFRVVNLVALANILAVVSYIVLQPVLIWLLFTAFLGQVVPLMLLYFALDYYLNVRRNALESKINGLVNQYIISRRCSKGTVVNIIRGGMDAEQDCENY